MVSAALIAVLALLGFYALRSIKIYLSLKHFGGHWSAGWSRIWLLHTQSSGQMNKIFTAVNDQYGEFCHGVYYPCAATQVAHQFADLPDERRTLRWLCATGPIV